jgi:hypothetical protein
MIFNSEVLINKAFLSAASAVNSNAANYKVHENKFIFACVWLPAIINSIPCGPMEAIM